MPDTSDLGFDINFRRVRPEDTGPYGTGSLSFGLPESDLYEQALAAAMYAAARSQDVAGTMNLGGIENIGSLAASGVQMRDIGALGALTGNIAPSGIQAEEAAYLPAGFQMETDYARFLEDLIRSQDPSFFEQMMPGLLPLLGAGIGLAIPGGGLAAGSLGAGLGGGFGNMFMASRY